MEPASTRINSVCTDGFCTQGTERSALYNEKFRPLVSQARLYAQTPHTLMRWAWQRLERRFGVLSAPVELNRPTRLRGWRRCGPHPRHVPHRSIYDALGRLLRHDRAGRCLRRRRVSHTCHTPPAMRNKNDIMSSGFRGWGARGASGDALVQTASDCGNYN